MLASMPQKFRKFTAKKQRAAQDRSQAYTRFITELDSFVRFDED
jgi:hypothetical protein